MAASDSSHLSGTRHSPSGPHSIPTLAGSTNDASTQRRFKRRDSISDMVSRYEAMSVVSPVSGNAGSIKSGSASSKPKLMVRTKTAGSRAKISLPRNLASTSRDGDGTSTPQSSRLRTSVAKTASASGDSAGSGTHQVTRLKSSVPNLASASARGESVVLKSGTSQPTNEGHVVSYTKALWDYKASDENPYEISFQKGEQLEVLDSSNKWWHVRKAAGTTGEAPSNYLQSISSDGDGSRSPQGSGLSKLVTNLTPRSSDSGGSGTHQVTRSGSSAEILASASARGESMPLKSGASQSTSKRHDFFHAKALYNYKASDEDPNEISLHKGERLEVLELSGNRWIVEKADSTTGSKRSIHPFVCMYTIARLIHAPQLLRRTTSN
ncbi:Cytoplasmic protein nck2 [Serendipita sp. 399]|nr:Cytoplasmic protein nck2 [Serendipita sp. 399]